MVIGPRQLEERVSVEESDAMARLEQQIDTHLTNTYGRYGGVQSITYSLDNATRQVRRFTLERLLDTYRRTGWNVRIVSDLRDGDFIEFTYQNPRHTDDHDYYFGNPSQDH